MAQTIDIIADLRSIKGSNEWKTIKKISKGWSSDNKFFVETQDGKALLLRVADIGQYDEKKKEFEIITRYSKAGFPMSFPIDFGICSEGKNVYMLLTWIEGKDLEDVLSGLPEDRQYQLGREAGTILQKIHSIKLDPKDVPSDTKRAKKLLQLSRYEESQVRIDGDETAISFVKDNLEGIWKKAPVYMHGDYHPGNLIYMEDGSIGVIDFNRWEVGDPYEEFYKLESFGIEHSIPYCIGQIDAYFDDRIPEDFWIAQAVYVAHASLYSIKWAEKFGRKEIDGMIKRCRAAFDNYDEFRRYIPKWYTDQYKNGLGCAV